MIKKYTTETSSRKKQYKSTSYSAFPTMPPCPYQIPTNSPRNPPLKDPLHLSNEYAVLAIVLQPNPHVHHYYKPCIHVGVHDVVHIHWLSWRTDLLPRQRNLGATWIWWSFPVDYLAIDFPPWNTATHPRVDWVPVDFHGGDPYEILHFLEKNELFTKSQVTTLLK